MVSFENYITQMIEMIIGLYDISRRYAPLLLLTNYVINNNSKTVLLEYRDVFEFWSDERLPWVTWGEGRLQIRVT